MGGQNPWKTHISTCGFSTVERQIHNRALAPLSPHILRSSPLHHWAYVALRHRDGPDMECGSVTAPTSCSMTADYSTTPPRCCFGSSEHRIWNVEPLPLFPHIFRSSPLHRWANVALRHRDGPDTECGSVTAPTSCSVAADYSTTPPRCCFGSLEHQI